MWQRLDDLSYNFWVKETEYCNNPAVSNRQTLCVIALSRDKLNIISEASESFVVMVGRCLIFFNVITVEIIGCFKICVSS